MNHPFTLALAGNPNVGKSTIFNSLTHLHQKTGNWAGKTVDPASGTFRYRDLEAKVVDLPGLYSLNTRSQEEAIAGSYLENGTADLLVVIGDATCPERGLRLLRQILSRRETADMPVLLCLNLCDEAEKKGIRIRFEDLAAELGMPVIPCSARRKNGLDRLKEELYQASKKGGQRKAPSHSDFSPEDLVSRFVSFEKPDYLHRQLVIDRLVTGRFTGTLLMLILLFCVFWITITGANYLSGFLSGFLFGLEPKLLSFLQLLHTPPLLCDLLTAGVYRTAAWVTSVMLPPMAVFFPLFTLLEDLGYLPRAAFHSDCAFRRCHACGKQCLTMCPVIPCRR